ncbi:hypothetical protein JCM10450v2_003179 [Rhodotorula kratochvilovae]
MRLLSVLALVGVTGASLAAAAVHSQPLGSRSIDLPSWHSLERRSKTGECTQAYISNANSGYCKQTCPHNQWPLFEGGCVCRAPYKAQGKDCVPACKNGFSINTAKTGCICREGKVTNVDRSKCLAACTSGSYPVGDGTCASCPSSFAKCSSATVATACSDGFFLSSGQCVTKENCPTNTFANTATKRCAACADKDASSCSDAGKTSALTCTTKFLFGGQCLSANDVPNGYYPKSDTNTAAPCDAGVKTCSGSGAGHALSCGVNKKNDPLLLTPKGTCALHCPSGFWGNKQVHACLPCDSTMLTCNAAGATKCAKDSAGTQLFLTPSKTCVLPGTFFTGYFPNRETNEYELCDDGVTSCVASGTDGTAFSCGIRRSDETTLYWTTPIREVIIERRATQPDAPLGSCVEADACPAGTWPNAVTNVCQACDAGEATCTGTVDGSAKTCDPGLYLSTSNDCLTSDQCYALGAYWPDDCNSVCSTCDAGEATCTRSGPGLALSCATDAAGNQLYLQNGDCISADLCPLGTFADAETKTCVRCDDGVEQCEGSGAGMALSCSATSAAPTVQLFLTADGNCVLPTECKSGSYPNALKRTCAACSDFDADAATCTVSGVETCSTLFYQAGQCVAKETCQPHTFADEDSHTCKTCSDPDALQCTEKKALKCENKFLYSGACINSEECPEGTFANTDSHECTACTKRFSGASTCTADEARSCFRNYLLGGACVAAAQCPATTFPSDIQSACLACTTVDPYAVTCKATAALSCAAGFALYEGGCTSSCPATAYNKNGICTECSDNFPGAQRCSNDGATSCNLPLHLLDGACIATCPTSRRLQGSTTLPARWLNPNTNTCDVCGDPNAETCNASGMAASCFSPSRFLDGNYCKTSAECHSSGKVPNTATNTCDAKPATVTPV